MKAALERDPIPLHHREEGRGELGAASGCDRWTRTPTRNSVSTRGYLKQDGKSR